MFETLRVRIYSAPSVIDQLADGLRSGFMVTGTGIWLGDREPSSVIELVADGSEIERVIAQASQLATRADENSILATVTELNAALITQTGERLPVIGSILETIR